VIAGMDQYMQAEERKQMEKLLSRQEMMVEGKKEVGECCVVDVSA
jgi:hypothetical protein